MQYLIQPDNYTDGQVFRLQVTDVPKVLDIATSPQPASLPLSYTSTEITLPMCGPGSDYTSGQMTWTALNQYTIYNFIDFAGGSTLYQHVNMTGTVWYDGAPLRIVGGLGVVEVYHR